MTEALTLLGLVVLAVIAIIGFIFGGLIGLGVYHERLVAAFYAQRDAAASHLRAQHELKRLIAGEGEGRETVHTHFDTTKG